MSIKLWNYYDSFEIENLVNRHNLNKIKVILYPLDEGYEVFMKINDREESMYFTYKDSRVLDSLDYGLLPTAILSGICQAKEQYLYSNYVIVEVFDRRYTNGNDSLKQMNTPESVDRKYLTVLKITDNSIMKLTGIKSRMGDLREEQQWVSRKSNKINLDSKSGDDLEDGYGFMNTQWFQSLVHKKHVSTILHRKQNARWNVTIDGKFHPDLLHLIKHTRLMKTLEKNFPIKIRKIGMEEAPIKHKIQIGDEMLEKMSKLFESQKSNIFKQNPMNLLKPSDCHEECVHQMIIRSPLSGSNFKLILSRCPLHNRHWGHLIVDQWEGNSTKPIRFELPGGYNQGRRLLNQLSEMLGARISINIETNAVADANIIDQTISPKQSESVSSTKYVTNDSIWESIESIMTKNIQSGKPLYDNRDSIICESDLDNCLKKKKALNITKNKLSSNNTDNIFQVPSKNNNSTNNSLLKASSVTGGEPQQKQSLYSLKDLNLDDLF